VSRLRDSGLLARFLFVIPESLVGTRDVRSRIGIPHAVADEWEELLFTLLPRTDPAPPGQPVILDLSDEARELWLTFAEKVERNQGPGGRFEAIADWSAKLPGAVARIAALLELANSRGQARTVGADSMRRAVRLGALLIPHAEAAFRLLGADAVEDDARALLRWIEVNHLSQFKRSEAQKALEGRFRTVKRLEEAAARLAEWNVLSPVRMQRNAGARPTPLYRVNPALFDLSRNSL
jgi:putative DNA primase/helicase